MSICIIPARAGSKRFKNKNIKKINGIPLIGMVITTAIQSKLFKRVIVSTDCEKIAFISRKYGAETPFLRSERLSNDFTPTYKVLIDTINKIKTQNYIYHFCIYPTSILINKKDLSKAFKKIKKTKSDFICPIAKFESNPFRSFIVKKKLLKYTWPQFQSRRSQDLNDLYYDTGSFYIYRTKELLKIKNYKILPKKSTFIELNKKLIDVNYLEDFKKLKNLKKND
tara:strand:- start:286 stop:960 length:675 start_codon:yes stop_codon:yes gene_type:complete